jgi:hypothetical protein
MASPQKGNRLTVQAPTSHKMHGDSGEGTMRIIRIAALLALVTAPAAFAEISFYVPIVTQVQGAAFYRTSLSALNAGEATRAFIVLRYRSPVDGTFQAASLTTDRIETNGVFAVDDVIDYMKSKGAIRAADQQAALFGTLEVQFFDQALNDPRNFSVTARTYSPGTGGAGTVGIAYAGRPLGFGSNRGLITTLRNGAFGRDGNSRANIGFVTLGNNADVRIRYIDPSNNHVLKDFLLSSVLGRLMSQLEVVQLNNVFGDPALAGIDRITVIANPGAVTTGYVVQLDNTTNDGSFFLMTDQ